MEGGGTVRLTHGGNGNRCGRERPRTFSAPRTTQSLRGSAWLCAAASYFDPASRPQKNRVIHNFRIIEGESAAAPNDRKRDR